MAQAQKTMARGQLRAHQPKPEREPERYTGRMNLPPNEILALLIAVSFAAGLNVYATVATLGLLGHFHAIALPQPLHLLTGWPIIVAGVALFGVEFFADKVPAFDLIWNALHTFIRVPVAALLAYQAASSLSPGEQLAAALAGGLIAFIAHGGKTAVRAAVTPSPEPISNIALSLGEDVLAIALTWVATWKPYIAAAAAGVLLLILILVLRWVLRALGSLFRGARQAI